MTLKDVILAGESQDLRKLKWQTVSGLKVRLEQMIHVFVVGQFIPWQDQFDKMAEIAGGDDIRVFQQGDQVLVSSWNAQRLARLVKAGGRLVERTLVEYVESGQMRWKKMGDIFNV